MTSNITILEMLYLSIVIIWVFYIHVYPNIFPKFGATVIQAHWRGRPVILDLSDDIGGLAVFEAKRVIMGKNITTYKLKTFDGRTIEKDYEQGKIKPLVEHQVLVGQGQPIYITSTTKALLSEDIKKETLNEITELSERLSKANKELEETKEELNLLRSNFDQKLNEFVQRYVDMKKAEAKARMARPRAGM